MPIENDDTKTLRSCDSTTSDNPFVIFSSWLSDAKLTEISDPTAMSLATIGTDKMPNIRIVLLKSYDDKGFVFYTNYSSIKGQEILSNMTAALCFHWKTLKKQIRIRGIVKKTTYKEADEYFRSRNRNSQIGAWASKQSKPYKNKKEFLNRIILYEEKFKNLSVTRPPQWSGFRVLPLEVEFWHEKDFRLHDRIVFARKNTASEHWQKKILYP